MTIEQLLDIPPAKLAALTDAELTELLIPLFPQARAAYIGPRTSTIMVGDRKVQKRQFMQKQHMVETLLKSKGINL